MLKRSPNLPLQNRKKVAIDLGRGIAERILSEKSAATIRQWIRQERLKYRKYVEMAEHIQGVVRGPREHISADDREMQDDFLEYFPNTASRPVIQLVVSTVVPHILSHSEHQSVVHETVSRGVKERSPAMAGISSNSLDEMRALLGAVHSVKKNKPFTLRDILSALGEKPDASRTDRVYKSCCNRIAKLQRAIRGQFVSQGEEKKKNIPDKWGVWLVRILTTKRARKDEEIDWSFVLMQLRLRTGREFTRQQCETYLRTLQETLERKRRKADSKS